MCCIVYRAGIHCSLHLERDILASVWHCDRPDSFQRFKWDFVGKENKVGEGPGILVYIWVVFSKTSKIPLFLFYILFSHSNFHPVFIAHNPNLTLLLMSQKIFILNPSKKFHNMFFFGNLLPKNFNFCLWEYMSLCMIFYFWIIDSNFIV